MKAMLRDGRIVRLRTVGQAPSKVPPKGKMKSPPTPAVVQQILAAPSDADLERIVKAATRAQLQDILDSLAKPLKRFSLPWYKRAAGGLALATPFAALPLLVGIATGIGARLNPNPDRRHDANVLLGAAALTLLSGAGLGVLAKGYSYETPTAKQQAAFVLIHALGDWLEANKFTIPEEADLP